MAVLRNLAIDWYRRVFGAPAGSDIREQGLDTVLDGNSAVALSEAAISTHAVLGGRSPASPADAVWLGEVEHGSNLFGQALAAQTADGPRGIVAAATGLALAGRRATAFLSGPDLGAAQDLLISAAGKHAPLVLHIGARAAAAHGSAPGSGHETAHLAADTGFFMLFAANVQEAVDFTYIARRVAEHSLVPGMVIMDGEQTALAAQDTRLLSPAQVSAFLGAADETIDSRLEAILEEYGRRRHNHMVELYDRNREEEHDMLHPSMNRTISFQNEIDPYTMYNDLNGDSTAQVRQTKHCRTPIQITGGDLSHTNHCRGPSHTNHWA